jgi:hypothetical protein
MSPDEYYEWILRRNRRRFWMDIIRMLALLFLAACIFIKRINE